MTLEDKEQFLIEVNEHWGDGIRHLVGLRLCPGLNYEGCA
jgi:hypothetical protein